MDSVSTLPDRYIEVQLAFASAMAQRTGEDIRDVVLRHTNFARRFGFGPPPAASTQPEWQQYADTLSGYGSFDEQLAWTIDFARRRPTNLAVAHPTSLNVGPFSADVSGSVVRTHFVPSDTDGLSPLHPAKRRRRAQELVELFDRVRDQHPDALSVRGVSWLYSTRTYQSLSLPATSPLPRLGPTCSGSRDLRVGGSSSIIEAQ